MRNGILNYERRVVKEHMGRGPIHRQEEDGRVEGRLTKLVGKDSWFRKGGKQEKRQGDTAV